MCIRDRLVKDYFDMEIVGETLDDAAGEAFDKTAKILNLPYPGGPLIDKNAQNGNPLAFKFPVPQIQGLNYSFSGFKTAILYFIRDRKKENILFVEENLADICASVQHSIVNIPVSYTHLDVYKRQHKKRFQNPFFTKVNQKNSQPHQAYSSK